MNINLPSEAIVITLWWLLSLVSAILLFAGFDASFATGEYMGFKFGGAAAACPGFFVILYHSYMRARKKDLEVHIRNDSNIQNLKEAKCDYSIRNKDHQTLVDWAPIDMTILAGTDHYFTIPKVNSEDYVKIRIKINDKAWASEWVTSSKRHLLFQEE